jgi:hypothetical protein
MREIMSWPWDECDAGRADSHQSAGVDRLLTNRRQVDPRAGQRHARLRGWQRERRDFDELAR